MVIPNVYYDCCGYKNKIKSLYVRRLLLSQHEDHQGRSSDFPNLFRFGKTDLFANLLSSYPYRLCAVREANGGHNNF